MGLELLAKPGPIPRDLMLKLICDGNHGLLPIRFDIFEGAAFPDLFDAAMALGWKETYGLLVKCLDPYASRVSFARLFLCPECSGKPQRRTMQ